MKQMFAHMEKMTAAAAQAVAAPSCLFCPVEILMDTTFVVSIFIVLQSVFVLWVTWLPLLLLQIFLLVRLCKVPFGRTHC